MNIFIVTTEFLNEDATGLVDGGVANEYYKFAKQLVLKGHKVTVLVCTTIKRRKDVNYEGINVIEFNPRKYFKILKTFVYHFKKLFNKDIKSMSIRQYLFLDGINKFLFVQNLLNKIDIVQYTTDSRLGVFPVKNIPSCVRIASYTKSFLNEYNTTNEEAINEEKLLYKNTRFVFGPSKYIANMIKEDLNLKNEIKIIETPFFKSTQELDYKYCDSIKDKKYGLFFGTLGALKGCFDVAEIIYKVLEENKDLYFVFVGKQVEYKGILPIDYIKQKAGQYSDRIIYFDKLQHKYLYPIIQNAQFCLMPSRTENFSNTCLEAMGFAKIVIGSAPFFNQIITDGENGFLCKAKDSKSIYEKICEVLKLTFEQRENIQANALKRIEKCNIEDKTNELIEYYKYVKENWKNK